MSVPRRASDELDFRLIFEDSRTPLRPTDLHPDDSASFSIFSVEHPTVNQPVNLLQHGHQSLCSPTSSFQGLRIYDDTIKTQNPSFSASRGQQPFECPSIQITSISPNCIQDAETTQELHNNSYGNSYMERPSHDQLFLQLESSFREPSLIPSPGSSVSSRSWISDASSCESVSHLYDDIESELNEATARFSLGSPLPSPSCSPREFNVDTWQQLDCVTSLSPRQSPHHSPRTSITDENWLTPRPVSKPLSRPTSPYGKRRHSSADIGFPNCASLHHSPAPSPNCSPRGSITEDTWIVGSPQNVGNLSPSQCFQETDIPLKTRKTSDDQSVTLLRKNNICAEDQGSQAASFETSSEDSIGSPLFQKKDTFIDKFLSVPSHITWNKPKSGHTPIFRTSSLPPLDWPLPCRYGQCELKVEVQPKTHHRAHYETEGSRGAVKAATGGHPVVKLLGYAEKTVNLQMFIGTSDDRYLRPHAFYQVHRITGKTVATASQEIILSSTKVLEIPLLPDNNMCASIDCAGILKLRNSDIELRKGETDVGRKNTRVRLVFRVHIPQPNGKVLSLQTASIPIECSQRSAQELPQVDKCSINSCSVSGGAEMIITGSNILPESKVIFVENGQDGRPQWEVEARILSVKRQMTEVAVEIPPFYNKSVETTVQVQFYLCNGKKKRSQSQKFTYTPALLKRECTKKEDRTESTSASLPHLVGATSQQVLLSENLCPVQMSNNENMMYLSERDLKYPSQPAYTTLANFGVQDPLQGRNVNGSDECLLPALQQLHHASDSDARSSNASFQSNVIYNRQSSLSLHLAKSQGNKPVCYPQEANAPKENSTSSFLCITEPLDSSGLSHYLQQISYNCQNTRQVIMPSSSESTLTGHTSLQLTTVSNHCKLGPTFSSSADTSPTLTHHPPFSGPSSPQLKSVLYQPSASVAPSSSPNNTIVHSGHLSQNYTPEVSCLPHPVTFEDHVIQNPSPCNPDQPRSIKSEPEDNELNFQTAGLQDITLDDVNEIIGRDMSHGTTGTSQECQKFCVPDVVQCSLQKQEKQYDDRSSMV